jgi:hypothetical protein
MWRYAVASVRGKFISVNACSAAMTDFPNHAIATIATIAKYLKNLF